MLPSNLLARCRAASVHAWLVLIQWLNWIAASIGVAVVAIDAMYHNEITEAFKGLPPVAKLITLALWVGLIHLGTRQAKKAA